jgi:hypothetical protein
MDKLVETEIEKTGIEIPEEFKGFLCEPPLLEGEDAKVYQGLLAAVIQDRQPKKLDEWIEVYDYVTALWEELRFRQASVGLMRGEMFTVLMHFLGQVSAEGQLKKLGEHEKLAFAYFGDNLKKKKEVVDLLNKYGITPAALHAKAAQLNSDAVQMFERLTNTRVKRRSKLRKRKSQ